MCKGGYISEPFPENAKVEIVSIHVSGKALLYHRSFMKSKNDWSDWEEYKTAIVTRFGKQPYDDPLADLEKLRQTAVEQSQDTFDA